MSTINRTAAEIARAYARFATRATGELLQLGVDASGASAACLYWQVREQIICVPAESAGSPAQLKLRQQIRREFWPWLHRPGAPEDQRVMEWPQHAELAGNSNDERVILLTLQDHAGELGGIIALRAHAAGHADILGAWREEAIGFADLVRENLLADLDRDTGLLTPASFDAEVQRWMDSAAERQARACLMKLHLDHLADIGRIHGEASRLKALQEVLGLIETRLRGRDVVARLGPACIGVMLRQCDLKDARGVCAALEDRLRGYWFTDSNQRYEARLRIGISVLDPRPAADNRIEDVDAEDSLPPGNGERVHAEHALASDADTASTGDEPAPSAHSATVLRFPARVLEPLPAMAGAALPVATMMPLRAQPCRLLMSTDRVVIHRLRGLPPGRSGLWFTDVLDTIARPVRVPLVRPAGSEPQRMSGEEPPTRLMVSIDAGLRDRGFVSWLSEACSLRNIPCSALCLAVSEASVIEDVRRMLPALGRLHRAGFELCMETGRAGVESPALMRRLPIDYLHTSMHQLTEQVALAEAQGAQVICGGVDADETVGRLAEMGVRIGHGRALGASIALSRLSRIR